MECNIKYIEGSTDEDIQRCAQYIKMLVHLLYYIPPSEVCLDHKNVSVSDTLTLDVCLVHIAVSISALVVQNC